MLRVVNDTAHAAKNAGEHGAHAASREEQKIIATAKYEFSLHGDGTLPKNNCLLRGEPAVKGARLRRRPLQNRGKMTLPGDRLRRRGERDALGKIKSGYSRMFHHLAVEHLNHTPKAGLRVAPKIAFAPCNEAMVLLKAVQIRRRWTLEESKRLGFYVRRVCSAVEVGLVLS